MKIEMIEQLFNKYSKEDRYGKRAMDCNLIMNAGAGNFTGALYLGGAAEGTFVRAAADTNRGVVMFDVWIDPSDILAISVPADLPLVNPV
jgi:hypothetical protein